MSKPIRDPYEVLGISPGVPASAIKKAYRDLVKKCHPDVEYARQTDNQRDETKKRMQLINEAYAILINKKKRETYDQTSRARAAAASFTKYAATQAKKSAEDEIAKETFLKKIFHPMRRSVVKVINQYGKRLEALEQDIFDDQLIEEFSQYVAELESTLRRASNTLTENPAPLSLQPSVQWMRHSIAQAVDGLEELLYFCQNFDYAHLSMASNLFKIAIDHSRLADKLTRTI